MPPTRKTARSKSPKKKVAKKKRRSGPPGKPERFEMVFSKKEKTAFMAAAKSQGISLAHWLRLSAIRSINQFDGKVELIELE